MQVPLLDGRRQADDSHQQQSGVFAILCGHLDETKARSVAKYLNRRCFLGSFLTRIHRNRLAIAFQFELLLLFRGEPMQKAERLRKHAEGKKGRHRPAVGWGRDLEPNIVCLNITSG